MFEGDRNVEEVDNDYENQKHYYVEDDDVNFPRELLQPIYYSECAKEFRNILNYSISFPFMDHL